MWQFIVYRSTHRSLGTMICLWRFFYSGNVIRLMSFLKYCCNHKARRLSGVCISSLRHHSVGGDLVPCEAAYSWFLSQSCHCVLCNPSQARSVPAGYPFQTSFQLFINLLCTLMYHINNIFFQENHGW